jgi:hypothetical protein
MATNSWTGSAGDGLWTTAGNWSLGHIPASGESIDIGSSNSHPTVDINNAQVAQIYGSLANFGALDLNSTNNNTDFVVNGDDQLTGGGTVLLSDNGNNRIYSDASASVLDNVNNTIEGAGQIFANAGLSIINGSGGAIEATFSDVALAVSSMSFTNNGVAEAIQGATLSFTSALTNISNDANHSGGSALTGGVYTMVDPVTDGAGSGHASSIAITGTVGGVTAAQITTLAATVNLTGSTSTLTSNGVALSGSLLTVASTGTLNLFYSTNSTTRQVFNRGANAFDVAGAVNVNGATFDAGALTVDSAATLDDLAYAAETGNVAVAKHRRQRRCHRRGWRPDGQRRFHEREYLQRRPDVQLRVESIWRVERHGHRLVDQFRNDQYRRQQPASRDQRQRRRPQQYGRRHQPDRFDDPRDTRRDEWNGGLRDGEPTHRQCRPSGRGAARVRRRR